jgi:hypothetical protein
MQILVFTQTLMHQVVLNASGMIIKISYWMVSVISAIEIIMISFYLNNPIDVRTIGSSLKSGFVAGNHQIQK